MYQESFNGLNVLAVDLDGTLIASDMLHESFWVAFSHNWKTPLIAMASLAQGRVALKQRLASMGEVDVTGLPYNDDVIAYVRDWRDQGGKAVLVTATHHALAEKIAAHLGIFDEVHGSDGHTNLKGSRKAAFLEDRYGIRGFHYIGDTGADLPVWEKAAKAITVTASDRLRQRVDAFDGESHHLAAPSISGMAYLKAIRVHQWLKNGLIFLPLLAAHALTAEALGQALLAFIAFSLVASSVYVLNDMLDLAADRVHPRKRHRPFASGTIPIAHGSWLAPALLVAGFAVAVPLQAKFIAVLLAYYVATTAYSLYLKRQILIDICMLACLYTVRIVAGAVATGIPLSPWLLAFSLFFFFALAAVKRQAELVDGVAAGEIKITGRGYHTDDLPIVKSMAIASGYVSVLVLALYVNSAAGLHLYKTPEMLWGVCLILFYWISRMVFIAHRGGMHDDPLVYAVKDRASHVCFLLALGFAMGGTLL